MPRVQAKIMANGAAPLVCVDAPERHAESNASTAHDVRILQLQRNHSMSTVPETAPTSAQGGGFAFQFKRERRVIVATLQGKFEPLRYRPRILAL